MPLSLLLACALAILDRGPVPEACKHRPVPPSMFETVDAVRSATGEFHAIPAEVVIKVIYRESYFDVTARGRAGEVGLMQIKRHGAIPRSLAWMPDRLFEDPTFNVYLGVKYMATLQLQCPRHWLTEYNGGGCKVGHYSRRVSSAGRRSRFRLASK